MSIHILLRLLLMAVFALLGWKLGFVLSPLIPSTVPLATGHYCFAVALLGAVVGFTGAPRLLIKPGNTLHRELKQAPMPSVLVSVIGLVMGLLAAALLTVPLSMLPGKWGEFSPLGGAVVFGFLGIALMRMHERETLSFLGLLSDEKIDAVESAVLEEIQAAIDNAENQMKTMGDPMHMFEYAYAEMSPFLKEQQADFARQLAEMREEGNHG